MKLTEELIKGINATDGKTCEFSIPRTREGKDRKEELISVLKENHIENIIHVGACGHLNSIQKQLDAGTWFHDRLCNTFSNVIGTDISENAVEYLQKKGKERLYVKDATTEGVFLKKMLCEKQAGDSNAIILPEVIEHIGSPVEFLTKIKENFQGFHIVATVPNAFGSWIIPRVAKKNCEMINSDHKYWFTPFTILKVFHEAGIEIDEIRFCDYSLWDKILKRNAMCNTLLVKGKL